MEQPSPSDNLYFTDLPVGLDNDTLRELMAQYGTVSRCKVIEKPGAASVHALVQYSSFEEAAYVLQNLNGQIINGLTQPCQVRYANAPGGKGGGDGGGKGGGWQGGNAWQGGGAWQGGPFGGAADATVTLKGKGKGASVGMDMIIKGLEGSGALPGGMAGKYQNDEACVYMRGLPPDCNDGHLFRIFATFGSLAPNGVKAMLNDDGTCKGFGFINFQDATAAQAAISTLNGAQISDGSMFQLSIKMPSKSKGKGKFGDVMAGGYGEMFLGEMGNGDMAQA